MSALSDSLFVGAVWRDKHDRTRRIRIDGGWNGERWVQDGSLADCERFSVRRNTSRRTQSISVETLYRRYTPMRAETRL